MQQVAPVPFLAGSPPAPPPTITHLPHTHLFCSPAPSWPLLPAGHGASRESHRCALCAAHAPLGRTEEEEGGGRECARGCGVQQRLCVLFSSDVRWGEGETLLFGVPASPLLRFSPGRQCVPHASEAVMTFRAWSRRTRQNCALFAPFAWTLSWRKSLAAPRVSGACGRPEQTSKEGSCAMRPFFILFRLRGFFSSLLATSPCPLCSPLHCHCFCDQQEVLGSLPNFFVVRRS